MIFVRWFFVALFLTYLGGNTDAASFRRVVDFIVKGIPHADSCDQCEKLLKLLKEDPRGTLLSALEQCKKTHFLSDESCDGEYHVYADSIVYIISRLNSSMTEACKLLLGEQCGEPQSELYVWDIDIDDIKDDSTFPASHFVPLPQEWPQTHLSVLHITDTHYDEDYDVGATADCTEPVCCTKYQEQTTDLKNFAGPWGHPYGKACNIPLRTLENLFKDIDRSRQVSFAIWTGDYSPHNLLGTSKNRTFEELSKTTAIIKRYLRNVRVIPALGNHDSFPSRLYPQPNIDAAELSLKESTDEMWNLWYEWLPADQETNFKYAGYFTTKITDKLRIISLNTNYCYSFNWWLVLDSRDPGNQLRWFAETLDKARRARERVYVIGHIPPGSPSCLKSWSKAYYKVVSKFNSTIAAQFFGHVHSDGILLHYGDKQQPEEPTTVVYVSPAATTSWSGMPEYRIYQTEKAEVVDMETYFLNLTTANEGYMNIWESVHDGVRAKPLEFSYKRKASENTLYGDPSWELGYSARKSYGLRKFDAHNWGKFVKRLEQDDKLLQTYNRHYMQFRSGVDKPCDDACRDKLIETTRTTVSLPGK